MIQGLILAAGKGRRLGGLLNGKPKGLLPVGHRTLIEHQIHAFRASGISRIAVIVGYGADYVRSALGEGIEFIENEDFATTNSLYSLWLARHWVDSSFIVANSDLFADASIYEKLIRSSGSALAYDSGSGSDPEEMKVSVRDGRVVDISKSMEPQHASGESIGLIKYDAPTAQRLFQAADEIVKRGNRNDWSPAATAAIAQDAVIEAIDIAVLPWTEIDFPADLDYARSSIWTRMQLRSGVLPTVECLRPNPPSRAACAASTRIRRTPL